MNEPSNIVETKGRPNRRKGCFWRALRYRAAKEFGRVEAKDLEVKPPGIVAAGSGGLYKVQCYSRRSW